MTFAPKAPDYQNYQKVRLWSGVFSIGLNLGLIWAFYLASLLVSPRLVARFDARLLLLIPVLAMLALGFVFDVLSGHAAETALGRTRQGFGAWARDWVLVSLRVAPALYLGLLLLAWLRFQSGPILAAVGLVVALFLAGWTLLLPAILPRSWRRENAETREFEAQLRLELAKVEVPAALPILWLESEDETTVNGAMAPLGRAQIWLASNVSCHLTPRQAALLIRRDWWFRRTQKHLAGTGICIIWLLIGLALARLLPAQGAWQAGLGGAALVTSWCFAALFVWPPLNQRWMRAADRDLLQVAPHEEIETLLRRVQVLNASDTQLSNLKSGVFHPIPDLNRRLEALK